MTTTIVVPTESIAVLQPVVDGFTQAAADINALQGIGVSGVATSTALAATSNKLRTVLTTEALTTAAAATAVFVITNSTVAVGDLVFVQRAGGTSTTGSLETNAVVTANTITLTLTNRHASVAFNGTFIFNILVAKAA